MKGRTEHAQRTKRNISNLLTDMPKEVSDFYYVIQTSKEPMTCLEYIRKIHHFLKFANMDLEQINDVVIGKYFESVKEIYNSDGEIKESSFSYQKTIYSALHQFFKYLHSKNIINTNPMSLIDRPKYDDNVKRIYLSLDDLNAILNTAKNGAGSKKAVSRQKKWKERDLLILVLFMNTGMRKTALSEINIEDISLDDNKLIIIDKRRTKQEYDLSDEMKSWILEWMKKREVILDGVKNDALFISGNKARMSEKSIYNLVKKYSEEALGYPVSPHKLRGAFITIYFKASGNDIEATRRAVGHKSVITTGRYISNNNDPRKEAIQFMSSNLKI